MTNWYHRQQHRDANHKAIVAALTYHGAIVADMGNAGGGVPDLLCGFRGVLFLVEVKTATGALSAKQREFFDAWTEYPALVGREMTATIDEIMAAIVDELQCLAEEIQCSNSSQDV